MEPFEIESIGLEDLLVVEGFISDETKQHQVRLSRTSEIDENNFQPVSQAQVQIFEDGVLAVSLEESDQGVYLTPPDFAGAIGRSYQLLIQTGGSNYASEEVTLKPSPPIDSIYGRFIPEEQVTTTGESGIQFFLDTHDPTSRSKFYRWEWEGVFEINTPLNSKFDWIEGNLVVRREIPVDRCFATRLSTRIMVKSSQSLEQDIISEFPLHFVPGGANELKVRYSLLVKQYSLSQEAYLFWEGLRIQNESQGSLFDVQPASVIGNIRSLSDQDEVVLGFFDASQVTQLRRFFTPEDFIPAGFIPPSDNVNCLFDTVAIDGIGAYMESLENSPTPREIHDVAVDKFLVTPRFCTDCSGRGEIEVPDYWE